MLKKFFSLYLKYIRKVYCSIVIIINFSLLIKFWKILLINDAIITNNNILLNKLVELLKWIGLENVSLNILKMIIVSIVLLILNISIIYFNKIALFWIPIGIAKYSYKSYKNYLVDSQDWNYMGFEIKKVPEEIPPEIYSGYENALGVIEVPIKTFIEIPSETHPGTFIKVPEEIPPEIYSGYENALGVIEVVNNNIAPWPVYVTLIGFLVLMFYINSREELNILPGFACTVESAGLWNIIIIVWLKRKFDIKDSLD